MKNSIKGTFYFLCLCLTMVSTTLSLWAEQFHPEAKNLKYVSYNEVFDPNLAHDAIVRNEPGFEMDFLILHHLIRKYQPANIFEIGTCQGLGTLIIKNAIGSGIVYSLELPSEENFEYRLTKETIGMRCTLPYVQLLGNSMTYDYTQQYPIESWFIDGHHEYSYVLYETAQALLSDPLFICWHDTDQPQIFQAVLDAFAEEDQYNLYRVYDTRMSFAVKKNLDP